jgi:PAS domain S-box-containing protein
LKLHALSKVGFLANLSLTEPTATFVHTQNMSDETPIEPQSVFAAQNSSTPSQTEASEFTRMGIVLQGAEGQIQSCNSIAAQLLGLTPEQLTRASPFNLPWQVIQVDGSPFPSDRYPAVIALRTSQPCLGVICGFYRPDGELIWLLMDAQPLFQKEGDAPYVAIVTFKQIATPQFSDSTIRQTEKLSDRGDSPSNGMGPLGLTPLYNNRAFVESLVKTVPGIVYLYDLIEHCNIFVNQHVAKWLGYSAEAIQAMGNKVVATLIHPADLPQVLDHFAQFNTARIGDRVEFEYRVLHANGEWRWFLSQEVLFSRTPEGLPHRVLGISQDITAQKQTEFQLRQANERFELAVSAVPSLIYDWDLEQNIVFRTAGLFQLLGFSPEEVEPTCDWWRDRIHPEDLLYLDDHNRILATRDVGNRYRFNYRICDRQNNYIPVLDQGVVVRNQLDQPIRMVGTVMDVSEQYQREAEREALREQTTRAAAEATNRVRDEFLLMLSHELRTPLNPILGWLSVMKTCKLDETRTRTALDTIERNAQRQKDLVDDLLNVASMLQGQLTFRFEAVNLVDVLARAIGSVQLTAQAKALQIQTEISTPSVFVLGDATRLQQVLWKLLSNAIKFTSTGCITVQLHVIEAEVQVQVIDTGKGIDPQFLPYVFDPFRQVDSSSTRQFGGLGLGLAIARHLIELHGGRIEVDSLGEAQGATFRFNLPRLQN